MSFLKSLLQADSRRNIERYITSEILPGVADPDTPFSITPASMGIHSAVYYLSIEGVRPLVVKQIRKAKRLRDMCTHVAHMRQYGIRVPEILFSRTSPAGWITGTGNILCEERFTGKTLKEISDRRGAVEPVAHFFARMHNITRTGWGKPGRDSTQSFRSHILQKSVEKTRQLRRYAKDFPEGAGYAVVKWLNAHADMLNGEDLYSLCHGDPNPGNIILTDSEEVSIVDAGNCRYLPRALEFHSLFIHCFTDTPEMYSLFRDTYCSEMPPGERGSFDAAESFFKMYTCVAFAAMTASWIAASSPLDDFYETAGKQLKAVTAEILNML